LALTGKEGERERGPSKKGRVIGTVLRGAKRQSRLLTIARLGEEVARA